MKESMKCFWLIVPVPMEGESRFLFQDKLVCNFFFFGPKSQITTNIISTQSCGWATR